MSMVTLAQAPLRTSLVLAESGLSLERRLTAFGLRQGTDFMLLQRTAGGGRVALVGGSRIALGASVLRQVKVEVA